MRDLRAPGWRPGKNVLFLSAREVREIISMREAIGAARAAYAAVSNGEAQVPVRTPVFVPEKGGVSLFMPGAVPGAVGMKMASVFPGNSSMGLPVILAVILMIDPETGAPACLMEGSHLTAVRTGAAAAVAADHMARQDASVAAVFGAGAQGRTQVMGLLEVRRLSEVRIVDINTDRARGLADEIAGLKDGPRAFVAPSAAEAVRGADIIVTATTSKTPLFSAEWLKAGAHINGVGSFKPDMREIGEDTVLRADRVVVDSREAALEEAGDIIIPLRKGLITEAKIAGEIGDVVQGRIPGRTSESEITFCKMVGLSALDVIVGQAVFTKAVAEGKGILLDL